MSALLALLVLLAAIWPAPPIAPCVWPVSLPRPVVRVQRLAPAHTVLTWEPTPGTTGVAVVAVQGRVLRGILDTDAPPAVVRVEDRQVAEAYLVYERHPNGPGCVGVALVAWNWLWLALVRG